MRFLTAGESHGKALLTILEGMPAGVPLREEDVDHQLARRQLGYGRGGRMKIENDRVEIISGVRHGLTLGSPIAMSISNRDWANWAAVMVPEPEATVGDQSDPAGMADGAGGAGQAEKADKAGRAVTRPRPGHADLAGGLKYAHSDLRNVLERASARETAARVVAGAVARRFLLEFGVEIFSHVVAIGQVMAKDAEYDKQELKNADQSPVRCLDNLASQRMVEAIDAAREAGDSLGGVFEVVAIGAPVGLGSHVHWDRRLDGLLAQALMSIPAIKGVEAGAGFAAAALPGSQVHDEIFYGPVGPTGRPGEADGFGQPGRPGNPAFYHATNRAGGLEGGITNGEPVVLRAAMKPIPTLYKPLRSVDIYTKEAFAAGVERSDICAAPAAAVVGEAMVALVLAGAFLEKFGGDSLKECRRNWEAYLEEVGKAWKR
ncbi:MAG: chorismate synthase [Firmicutes bacterium]|nr:chorismate synthase [Bacillota bacterium]